MTGLRKAAVLIDTLDPAAADLLLERLSPGQAEKIRSAWMELGAISPQERRQVLDEFRQMVPKVVQFRLEGREEPRSSESRLAAANVAARHSDPSGTGESSAAELGDRPFRTLLDAEADKVAGILLHERPQTVALVLSQLPPQQSGAVLVRLPPALQVEVMRRLVDLEETDPEVVKEVDRALQAKLSDVVAMQRRRVAGWSAVAGILQHAPQPVGDRLLHTISQLAPDLADRLPAAPAFDFNHLIRFDDISLGVIFEQLDPAVTVLALWGTPLGFQERALAQLPSDQANRLQREMADLGPVRLSDVEEARRRVAESARRLAAQQRIRVPPELKHLRMSVTAGTPTDLGGDGGSRAVERATFVREIA
ncbi:MAG: FliG C-terminal domain-containing protein [Thermogutta sp.]